MKKKPDILVVLAAVLGLGIAISSVGSANNLSEKSDPSDTRAVEINR
ncbi:hypothetical protein [Pleionea sediminis]|nr:hypothetical protein [Pleionea sediminis]